MLGFGPIRQYQHMQGDPSVKRPDTRLAVIELCTIVILQDSAGLLDL